MTATPEPITESDIEDLAHLFGSAGPFVSARSLSDYWLYARLFGDTCLCVRSDGRPVAAIIAFCDQTPGKNEIYIQDVAVETAHRKKGFAQALMEELHRRAEERSIERIWLTSEAENAGAMTLWAKLGYENRQADYKASGVWLTRDLKGPGRDRAVYDLRLASSGPNAE